MDVKILNKGFNWKYSIDQYKSFIWTERYNKYGDFEVYVPMDSTILKEILLDDYVSVDDSDRLMIVENLETTFDPDEGDMLIVSGRSLESILTRRIEYTWQRYYTNVDFQEIITQLFDRNIVPGKALVGGEHRGIPNLKFRKSDDERISNSIKYTGQTDGIELYSFISDECQNRGIGFKLLLENNSDLVCELYMGDDRSYAQNKNPWVIFSPDFGNLISSSFINSNADYKNCALTHLDSGTTAANVDGYVRSNVRRNYISVGSNIVSPTINPEFSGLNCREMYLIVTGDINAPAASWNNMDRAARNLGLMNLGKHKIKNSFSGEGEDTNEYIYKKDYFLGDIVQLEDQYGNTGSARISEFVICDDTSNGYQKYPEFEMV